ncbi:transposase [Candidatus Erwinia dacicola]|nr:transposase [Candidatus Erwinia dacicola]NJD00215.1 transposase [Candidatus Erwinia dacicola]NJD84796.1 transposase [Candidatus Erwinia dacicola]
MAKHFTPEFKLEAAKLVVDHGYTYVKAAEAVNVSHSAIPRWVNKLRLERQGKTPAGLPLTPEQVESVKGGVNSDPAFRSGNMSVKR